MRQIIAMAAFILTGLVPATAQAQTGAGQPRLPEGIRAQRDVEYARAGDRPLLLDIFYPEKAGKPAPLIIWVHGGAWRAGSKNGTPAMFLLRHGYAVASVEYRLSQVATFPAQIEDCKAAVRFLRANAKRYSVDPERFGAWGSSAGGHLVALLGTAGDVKAFDKGENLDVSSRVQAVCDWFGPTNFLKMGKGAMDHDSANSPESLLVGGPIQQNPEKVAAADPITYVTKDDPPFLIMHGDKDNTVPINQSELLHAALQKAGVSSVFKVMEGQGHGFRGPGTTEPVLEFFDKQLRPAEK